MTGQTAENLLTATKANIAAKLERRTLPASAWRSLAQDVSSKDPRAHCPRWDGKEPAKTLRSWMRSQLFWQAKTGMEPEQWGIALLESFAEGSLPRLLAETIPDHQLITTNGYVMVLTKVLANYQAYLEVELEKASLEFFYCRPRQRGEFFGAYVTQLELLAAEMDQQLHPAPPVDSRLKAVVLLRGASLEDPQRQTLAIKKPGTQKFDEVAVLLRALDRPSAFLANVGHPPRAALMVDTVSRVVSLPSSASSAPETRRETISITEVPDEEHEQNVINSFLLQEAEAFSDDEDSQGSLKLDFDMDAEYHEVEAEKIVIYAMGRRDVRAELAKDRLSRGFAAPSSQG